MSNTNVALADKPAEVDQFTTQGLYGDYELARIRKSPDNRKRFNEANLQELAASIKSMGVAQPILIRPVTPTAEAPEDFEIVAGERRYRASIIAGMTTIPAVVRILSDLDAAKLRILENLQREDPHPMEEAEGYQLLMLQHGFSADQLAYEVNKSRAYIYARLKLCALTPEVREQFLDNVIPASTALLIARIPVPKLQVKALGEILRPQYGTAPMSYRQAATHVQSRYMLDLGSAIFKLGDSKLLARAGACTTCPKRAGNQPEVFEDIGANVCTDPDCFAEKRAAHHDATIVQANKKGIPVYEGDEAAELIQSSWAYSRGEFVQIGSSAHISYFERNAPDTKNAGYVTTYLSKEKLPPVAAYVRNSAGEPVALYKRVEIQAALEAAGACETVEAHAERMRAIEANPKQLRPADTKMEAETKERLRLEQKATDVTAFRVGLYTKLRARAASNGFSLQSLREFTKVAMDEFSLPSALREIYPFDINDGRAIAAHIDQAGLPEVQLLLVDALLGGSLEVDWYDIKSGRVDDDDFSTILEIAQHEGIDPNQVREELFPSPIDVTGMQYDDLVNFIKAHPARINELKDAVLECIARYDLIGLLEKAAGSLGYVHQVGGFVFTSAPAESQPHESADADAEQLAEQMAAAEAAEQPTTKAAKAAKKKKAPAPEPVDAWPFPKTSDGKREAAAPAADGATP